MVTRSSSPVPFDQPHYVLKHHAKANHSLTLFQLIQNSSWQDAATYVRENPSEACNWIIKPDCDEAEWRRLPLHEACIRLPTVEFIDILIKAYPHAVEEPDHNGRLPVHHACCHGASLDVVEKLVLCAPKTLDVLDVWGKDPLSVAQGAIGPNRDLVIAAVSRGSEFYRDMILMEQWTKEQEERQKAKESEYQARIQMQEKRISQLMLSVQEEGEQFELVKRQQRDVLSKIREDLKKEKEKCLETIVSLKSDLDSKQATIEKLHKMIQEKDQRFSELEQQLQELSVDLDREVSITSDLKIVLRRKEIQINSLTKALQEERKRGESLASSLSELSLRVTTQNIELERLKEANDQRQGFLEKENATLRQNVEEVLQRCEALAASESSLKVTAESLAAKLNLSNSDNIQTLNQLANVRLECDALEKRLVDKEREAQSLRESARNTVEALQGRNAQLEGETSTLLKKIEVLEKERKTLELKCSYLEEHVAEQIENEASLKEKVELASSQLIVLRKRVAAEEVNVEKISTALENERRQNQSLRVKLEESAEECTKLRSTVETLQTEKPKVVDEDTSITRQLHDTRINYDKIVNRLKKEKSELEFKVFNLEAAIRHMTKERQDEENSRNLAFASFEATMKKAGEEHLKLLNSLVVSASVHESDFM